MKQSELKPRVIYKKLRGKIIRIFLIIICYLQYFGTNYELACIFIQYLIQNMVFLCSQSVTDFLSHPDY